MRQQRGGSMQRIQDGRLRACRWASTLLTACSGHVCSITNGPHIKTCNLQVWTAGRAPSRGATVSAALGTEPVQGGPVWRGRPSCCCGRRLRTGGNPHGRSLPACMQECLYMHLLGSASIQTRGENYEQGNKPAALQATVTLPGASPSSSPLALQAVRHLQASIKYEAGDLRGCRAALEALPPGSAAATTAGGCIAYKEGQYAEAAAQFGEAAQMAGYPPELAYAVAVCQYQQRDYAGGATVVLRVK